MATDLTIDTILLVGFIANESFRLTGLVIHEWIGAVLALAVLTHLALHWNWIARTSRRLLAKPAGRDTLRWANDLALMFAMTICIASGLFSSRVVLPLLGLAESRSDYWLEVHLWSARFCLLFVALHVALSWRWVVTTISRLSLSRLRKASQ